MAPHSSWNSTPTFVVCCFSFRWKNVVTLERWTLCKHQGYKYFRHVSFQTEQCLSKKHSKSKIVNWTYKLYSQPKLYKSSPQLIKFLPKSFPPLIRKYVTRGFKNVSKLRKPGLLNHRPVYFGFHRGHLGTWTPAKGSWWGCECDATEGCLAACHQPG